MDPSTHALLVLARDQTTVVAWKTKPESLDTPAHHEHRHQETLDAGGYGYRYDCERIVQVHRPVL